MGNSGQFHTEMARIGIEHIGEMTDAKVDALLTAHERIGAAIDNDAVNFINREAAAIYDIQGQYLIAEARKRAVQSGTPPGVASAVAATIEAAMTAIKARINRKLQILRDEHILDMQSAAHHPTPVPQPENAATEMQPSKNRLTVVDKWIIGGVIVTVIGIIVTVYLPEIRKLLHLDKPSVSQPADTSKPSNPQPETPRKPLQVVTADNIAQLRRRNEVTRLHKTESGKTLAETPPGSFGFTLSVSITLHDSGTHREIEILSDGLSSEFEIHKLADGRALLVGYVGPETFDRLREGIKLSEPISLYSDSWKEAPNLIAVPLSQIKCVRYRDFWSEDKGKRKPIDVLDCQTQ
jgi:hypothetical protein